jgi:hypothetical protein
MSVEVSPDAPPDAPAPERDSTVVRICGVIVVIIATVVTAVAEFYLNALRVGGVQIGAGVVFAGLANYALCWFAVTTTGRRWSIGPPWALWTAIMMFAAGVRTTEGDYLFAGDDWMAMVMVLVGSLVFAVYAYRLILRGPKL